MSSNVSFYLNFRTKIYQWDVKCVKVLFFLNLKMLSNLNPFERAKQMIIKPYKSHEKIVESVTSFTKEGSETSTFGTYKFKMISIKFEPWKPQLMAILMRLKTRIISRQFIEIVSNLYVPKVDVSKPILVKFGIDWNWDQKVNISRVKHILSTFLLLMPMNKQIHEQWQFAKFAEKWYTLKNSRKWTAQNFIVFLKICILEMTYVTLRLARLSMIQLYNILETFDYVTVIL